MRSFKTQPQDYTLGSRKRISTTVSSCSTLAFEIRIREPNAFFFLWLGLTVMINNKIDQFSGHWLR